MAKTVRGCVSFESLLVVGYGVTGKAVVDAGLKLRSRGHLTSITLYPGMVKDSQTQEELDLLSKEGVEVVPDTQRVEGSFDIAVVSPGIAMHSELYRSAEAASAELLSEPEFAWRLTRDPWIAITGTNGKTTTTSLTHHLLNQAGISAAAVGNIGTPCITAVMQGKPQTYVAELSSYQLHSTKRFAPNSAAIINITPDHLAWHQTHSAYAQAKEKIFAQMTGEELAVINVDDPHGETLAQRLGDRDVRLGIVAVKRPNQGLLYEQLKDQYPYAAAYGYLREDGILCYHLNHHSAEICSAQDLSIKGTHNVTNALIATLLAADAGLDAAQIACGLRSFAPLEHRLEPVATHRDVLYVNDSKATNTDAALQALTAFEGRKILVLLGGADKGTDLSDFSRQVVHHAKGAICFGAAKERFAAALAQEARHEDFILAQCDSLRDALFAAHQLSAPGDCVVLSPACSSFDEFSSFEHRGRRFKELVHELINQEVERR